MRIGSLFSGIGGLELGLERAGVGRTIWQCEAHPYARRVLVKHWPDATLYPDVCALGRQEPIPYVEVICGGFPCQDISFAGKGAGLAGAKSGLFYELLRVVDLVGPRYIVMENVAAILTRGLGAVLGSLAARGFDAEWDCLPASSVGAPHRRDRWFLVAYPAVSRSPERGLHALRGESVSDAERGGRSGAHAAEGVADSQSIGGMGGSARAERAGRSRPDRGGPRAEEMAHTRSHRPQGLYQARAQARTANLSDRAWNRRPTQPGLGRTLDGLSAGVDRPRPVEAWEGDTPRTAPRGPDHRHRLRCLGNAVVPQVAEVIGRKLLQIEASRLS